MKIFLPLALSTIGYAQYNLDAPTVLKPHGYKGLGATDAQNATKSVKAIKDLATSIQVTEAAEATADTVVSALDGLQAVSNVFGIAGVFLSFVELFLPDEDQMILKELKKIEGQIEHLREDMVYFFSKVINEEKQASCFSQLAPYEDKIRSAWHALHQMHANHNAPDYNTYVNIFKDECSNAQCSDAAHGILNTISGNGSFLQCDMLSILYEGNP